MAETQEVPAAWLLPFSVADQMVIDRLPERAREAVERYIRASGSAFSTTRMMTDDELADTIADSIEGYIDIRSDVESAVISALRRFRREEKA